MKTYDLYAESGPRHRQTYIHVPEILGCVVRGSTTEEAVRASPEAIRQFLRFLHRHGEAVDVDTPFEVTIVEHITEGTAVGEGLPYISFPFDLAPLTREDIDRQLERSRWVLEEFGEWASNQSPDDLAVAPDEGKSARDVLQHVLVPQGKFLSWALGRVTGFAPINSAAERGELSYGEAYRLAWERIVQRIGEIDPDDLNAVRQMTGYVFTLRKALRRMIEHPWEHLVELSHRPNGPTL